jgi:hypothetical protein
MVEEGGMYTYGSLILNGSDSNQYIVETNDPEILNSQKFCIRKFHLKTLQQTDKTRYCGNTRSRRKYI